MRSSKVGTRPLAAFTLLELVVVLAIIGVLVGLLVPAVQRARETSAGSGCRNNLRQIGLALHGYHDGHRVLPPGIRRAPDPYPFMGWGGRLLPHLEQQALWEQARGDYARQPDFGGPPPHPGLTKVLPMFVCPSDGRSHGIVQPEEYDVAFTHYLGVSGLTSSTHDGVLFFDSQVSLRDITDGTSNTLMVGERPPSPDHRFGWWYAGVGQSLDGSADMLLGVEDYRDTFRTPTCPKGPYFYGPGDPANICDIFHFWSRHPGGAHFLMADGSVHFLGYSAKPLLPALASRRGGEAVALP
jgi:prepilin-type processing-associated H-X9-DG protein/prepilin-type N-terminal cleavage/methylation domain-containing protein